MNSKNNITSLIFGLFLSLSSLVSYSNEGTISLDLYTLKKIDKCQNLSKSFLLNKTNLKSNLAEKSILKAKKEIHFYFTANTQKDSVKPDSNKKEANVSEIKKPFFGKIFTYGLPPAKGTGPCEVGVFKTSYVFGIKISGPKPVMKPCEKNEDILSQEVVGCGEEYVPEKEKDKALKKDKKDKKEIAKINNRKKRKQDDFLDGL